jgi:hypothetical protein
MRYRIVFEYHRVPKQHVYGVTMTIVGFQTKEDGDDTTETNTLYVVKRDIDLQDAAVMLHHALKFVSSTGCEFHVRCVQAKHGDDLTLNQIKQLMESEDSARAFFAPTVIERKANAHS